MADHRPNETCAEALGRLLAPGAPVDDLLAMVGLRGETPCTADRGEVLAYVARNASIKCPSCTREPHCPECDGTGTVINHFLANLAPAPVDDEVKAADLGLSIAAFRAKVARDRVTVARLLATVARRTS